MNIKQMLAELAKPLLRPLPSALRDMSDDDLAAEITTLETGVAEQEQVVARLQPDLDRAAAESYAAGDLAGVEGNEAALRKIEAKLTNARQILAGLRDERQRRAADREIERGERRRKAAEEAVVAYIDAAKRMDAAFPEFVARRGELHVAREALFRALPVKIRGELWPELLRADAIDNQIMNRLCGLTDGQLIRPKGLLSPFELSQLPGLGESVAPLRQSLATVVFNGGDA